MRLILFFLAAGSLFAGGVRVGFNPADPAVGPFPSDFLTTLDSAQRTGLRVDLPKPDCGSQSSTCQEIDLINTLDGFHLRPRIAVRFSGPVNPDTLRDGIFIVWLDTAYPRKYTLGDLGKIMPLNQVQYEPSTNTAYARPDSILEQGRRFAIFVTAEVRDAAGDPVEIDAGFQACVDQQIGGDYCVAVSRATGFLPGRRIVGGSVFTTLSASSWMENARTATSNLPGGFRRTGTANTVSAVDLRALVYRKQTKTTGPLIDEAIPLTSAMLTAAGVGRIAFGSFQSPKFVDAAGTIAPAPTALLAQQPRVNEEIFFHAFLPATPPPPNGYPVILAGHGLTDNRFGIPSVMALNAAARGFAVVAFNAFGHGQGPEGKLRVTTTGGETEYPAPGRGFDADRDGSINELEGCLVLVPGAPVAIRDCVRQTAMDYIAFVRALREGIDMDGDGRRDLDASKISYFGMSLGSFYGTVFTAMEPAVSAAVLNVGGAGQTESARYSPTLRLGLTLYLGLRTPSALNGFFGFNEQYPEPYQPVQLLTAAGAANVGEVLDRLEWLEAPGAPMCFAPLLKSATLDGYPIKRVLFQMAWGDQTVPNPSNTLLIRAANLRENTSLYRHDWAKAAVPSLPENPHSYLSWIFQGDAALVLATAANQQALAFLQSDSESVPDVGFLLQPVFGRNVFEVPEQLPVSPNYPR